LRWVKHKKQGWSDWLIRLFVCLLAGILSVDLFTPPVQQGVAHPEELRATCLMPLQTNEQLFTIVRSVLFHTSRPVQHVAYVSSLSGAPPTFASPTLRYNRNSTVGRGDTHSRRSRSPVLSTASRPSSQHVARPEHDIRMYVMYTVLARDDRAPPRTHLI